MFRRDLTCCCSIPEVNIGNDKFHVKPTFKYLGYTIDQCGSCSDAVSTHIVSSWKAFQELLSSPTSESKQNLEGMSTTCV